MKEISHAETFCYFFKSRVMHYACLVVGDDVDAAMAPFHQYECTGLDNEYVINVDVSDRAEKIMLRDTEVIILDDIIYSRYDQKFQQNLPTNSFMNGDSIIVVPTGAIETTIPFREFLSIEGRITEKDYLFDSYGYEYVEGKYIEHTNPNAEWDWYKIGGRWKDFLLLKSGQRVDRAMKKDIDFHGMRNAVEQNAIDLWTESRTLTTELWLPKSSFEHGSSAWKKYHGQVMIKNLGKSEKFRWGIDDDLLFDLDEYVFRKKVEATSLYSYIKDGKFFKRGSYNYDTEEYTEMNRHEWAIIFNKFIDEIPDDQYLTVVDFHI